MEYAADAGRMCPPVDRTNQVNLSIQHCGSLQLGFFTYAFRTSDFLCVRACPLWIFWKWIIYLTMKVVITCKSLGSWLFGFLMMDRILSIFGVFEPVWFLLNGLSIWSSEHFTSHQDNNIQITLLNFFFFFSVYLQFVRFLQAITNLSWPQRPFCGNYSIIYFPAFGSWAEFKMDCFMFCRRRWKALFLLCLRIDFGKLLPWKPPFVLI